jgi:Nickel responsive protein SCO4226-like
MTTYIADRDLPGVTLEQLAVAQKAAIETSQRFTAEGKPVRYIRTAWVPSESHVMCMFEAEDPQAVRDVNEAAGIPFTRILEAMDLTPSK